MAPQLFLLQSEAPRSWSPWIGIPISLLPPVRVAAGYEAAIPSREGARRCPRVGPQTAQEQSGLLKRVHCVARACSQTALGIASS